MSISLYTPATGFPDLEIKIAYGLARVGIEAGYEPVIIPQGGFYQIDFGSYKSEKIDRTFMHIAKILLSSDRFFILGVKTKDKSKYPVNQDTINRLKIINISDLFNSSQLLNFNIKRNKLCCHKNLLKFGATKNTSKLGGLVLLASSHAGKPYYRDKRYDTFNLSLCEVCGYLAVLGIFSFCFNIQLGKGKKNRKYVNVLPIPKKELEYKPLRMLLALQKTLHNFWLSDLIPLDIFTLCLLAKVPSLSDFILEIPLNFHLSLVSQDNRRDTVIEQTSNVTTFEYTEFINNSPYNSVVIDKLLDSTKKNPELAPLMELNNAIIKHDKNHLMKFVRCYVQKLSTDKFITLLYPETSKYLLKEVAMISSEIIENPALGSLARTLRYFIREKKYGYADAIRNARHESKEFEETIAKMLREGELRRVQQDQDKKQDKKIENWIHIPKESEVKEVFRLINDDFDKTKTALVILAFSFPSRAEESAEDIEEVENA